MKSRNKILLITLLFCFILTACQNKSTQTIETEAEAKVEAVVAEEEQEDQKELRIVAGTVSAMQYLNALGVDVVGIPTTEKEIPSAYIGKPEIGLPMTPSQELVLSCEPDIFVSDISMKSNIEEMFYGQDMEIILLNNNTYGSIAENITILAEKLNLTDKAEELTKEMQEKKEKALELAQGKEAPRVAVIFGTSAMFMLATDNSYAGSLVELLGAENITDGLGLNDAYVTFDREKIAELDPEVILLLSHADPTETKKAFDAEFANPFWQEIKAVQEGKVFELNPDYFGVTANYNSIDAPLLMAQLLYEE